MHQVVTTGVERTSFVFFYYPSFDATLPAAATDNSDPLAGEAPPPLRRAGQHQKGLDAIVGVVVV